MVLIGYAGPARVLDASLLGDSLYLGMRRDDFAVTGPVQARDGIGAEWLRFLLQPWDFGPEWIRTALGKPSMEESTQDGGWIVGGTVAGSSGTIVFTLLRDAKGEPRRLELSRNGESQRIAIVRYGPLRGYAAGRYPRWIEWEHGQAKVRLDLRDVDVLPDRRLRVLSPPPSDWRVVGLKDPDGKRLVERLLGTDVSAAAKSSAAQEKPK